jgi:hypothetical protein
MRQLPQEWDPQAPREPSAMYCDRPCRIDCQIGVDRATASFDRQQKNIDEMKPTPLAPVVASGGIRDITEDASLNRCLGLLNGKTDEEKFAGLLLVTKTVRGIRSKLVLEGGVFTGSCLCRSSRTMWNLCQEYWALLV